MKIAIGSDHAGFVLKNSIIKHLNEEAIIIIDEGAYTEDSVDYPDIAKCVGTLVANKSVDFGILICGTGIGMSIAANKINGVRAAIVYDVDIAKITREHNDSNVLCLGQRVTENEKVLSIVDTWLHTDFENGRHQIRVDKIRNIEIGTLNN